MYETVLYQYHFADPVGLDQQPADRQWDEDQPVEGHPPAHTHTKLDYTPPEGCVHSRYREASCGDLSLSPFRARRCRCEHSFSILATSKTKH